MHLDFPLLEERTVNWVTYAWCHLSHALGKVNDLDPSLYFLVRNMNMGRKVDSLEGDQS